MYNLKFTPPEGIKKPSALAARLGSGQDQLEAQHTSNRAFPQNAIAKADRLQIAGAGSRLLPTQCYLCGDDATGSVDLHYPDDWDYAQCMQASGVAGICDRHIRMRDAKNLVRERWLAWLKTFDGRQPLAVIRRYDSVLGGLTTIGAKQ